MILYDLEEKEYHARPEMSRSKICGYDKSPAYFKWKLKNPTEESNEMKLGSAVHTMFLEEDKFDDDYLIRTCDLNDYIKGGEDRARFVKEFGESLEDIGFAILINHGVEAELYNRSREKVIELFENYSVESRMKFRAC